MDLSLRGLFEALEKYEKIGITLRDLDSGRVFGSSP